MGLLKWLRGDVDAFEAATRDPVTEADGRAEERSSVEDLRDDLARDFGEPPDAAAVSFDVTVELKSKPGDSTLEAVQPRIRQEGGRVVVEVDLPGLREDSVAVERGESETRLTGERESGPFVVRLRASPPPSENDVDVQVDDDVLTISFLPPLS